MVTYEVTAEVEPALAEPFERWLRERHVPDVLATGCFAGASLARSTPGRYRIRYEAHDRAALDRYLAEHAPRLRGDSRRAFPRGVTLGREEWDVLETWDRPAGGT